MYMYMYMPVIPNSQLSTVCLACSGPPDFKAAGDLGDPTCIYPFLPIALASDFKVGGCLWCGGGDESEGAEVSIVQYFVVTCVAGARDTCS